MNDFFDGANEHFEDNAGLYGAMGGVAGLKNQERNNALLEQQKACLEAIQRDLKKTKDESEREAEIVRFLAEFEQNVSQFSEKPTIYLEVDRIKEVLESHEYIFTRYGSPSACVKELETIKFAKKMEVAAEEFGSRAFLGLKYLGEISILELINKTAFKLYNKTFLDVCREEIDNFEQNKLSGAKVESILNAVLNPEELDFLGLASETLQKLLDDFIVKAESDNGVLMVNFTEKTVELKDRSVLEFQSHQNMFVNFELKLDDFLNSSEDTLLISSQVGTNVLQVRKGYIKKYKGATASWQGTQPLLVLLSLEHYPKIKPSTFLQKIMRSVNELPCEYLVEQMDGEVIDFAIQANNLTETSKLLYILFRLVFDYDGELDFEIFSCGDIGNLDNRLSSSSTSNKLEKPINEKESSCFVATAVYGDPQHQQVVKLRSYRDGTLSKSLIGRSFIRLYYKTGPHLAILPNKSKVIKSILKNLLDRF